MATETWYIMEDGTMGDPREVSAGDDGILRHADGRAVAYASHGPRSCSVEVEAKPFGGKGDHDGDGKAGGAKNPAEPKQIEAEKPTKGGYKTRQTKTR